MRLSGRIAAACSAIALAAAAGTALGDAVILKTGVILRGTVDKDMTIVQVFDGLKRIVVRDTKILRIEPTGPPPRFETFNYLIPLAVHAGAMPKEAVVVQATPWNDRARRTFAYIGTKSVSKPVTMTQAITELGPRLSKVRGVDGFWIGQVPTSTLPRELVMGMLGQVPKENQPERLRRGRFLIQAEWYEEARADLDALGVDFPELAQVVVDVKKTVNDLEAKRLRNEIDVRRAARQPQEVKSRLSGFPAEDVDPSLLEDVRDQIRKDEAQAASDRDLADSVASLAREMSADARESWNGPLVEVLRSLDEAPDAVRDRFEALGKADRKLPAEARFALAMSGFAVGGDAAVDDLGLARNLWKARDAVRAYLASRQGDDRASILARLQSEAPAATQEQVARLARKLGPSLPEEKPPSPGQVRTHRVRDDDNDAPTEYSVVLPPEYHPLRDYPTVVALHGGKGPQTALAWWAVEAARRGYIVIAPEYNLPGQPPDYRYSGSEHAAVELALRDARRRYSVDSDRVYLGGVWLGANMAFDFGLAHPDLFAGVVAVSGEPYKYVPRYSPHFEKLPLYAVFGDLAPASNEVFFGTWLKPMISKNWDVTYVEYARRGREEFPEEAPAVFDWMDRRRRDPFPRSAKFESARPGDNRIDGLVIREHKAGTVTAPDAVEPNGSNLHPARLDMKIGETNNRVVVRADGVNKLDVWLGPRSVDFSRRIEVEVNGRPKYKAIAKPDLGPMLEDLRVRGDRQQMYWLKVSVG